MLSQGSTAVDGFDKVAVAWVHGSFILSRKPTELATKHSSLVGKHSSLVGTSVGLEERRSRRIETTPQPLHCMYWTPTVPDT